MRGVGYLISIISVFLLDSVAWPKPDEPGWKMLAVVAGMATSILGMSLRWASSRKQMHELHHVEREVDGASSGGHVGRAERQAASR